VHAPTSHREEKDLLLHFYQQKGSRPKSRDNRSPEDILDLGSSESFKNAPIKEIFEAGGSCRGLKDDWTTSADDEDELAMTNMPSDFESLEFDSNSYQKMELHLQIFDSHGFALSSSTFHETE
jgi:hypothetical protein